MNEIMHLVKYKVYKIIQDIYHLSINNHKERRSSVTYFVGILDEQC